MKEYNPIKIPISQPLLSESAREYLLNCVDSGWISSKGNYVSQFEAEFAKLIGVKHAISVSNGTAALHLALLSIGIKPGDEVIVPDLTFAATANAVIHCGATPVLVDVDRFEWTLSIDQVKSAITTKTKAIIPVHLYGNPARLHELQQLAHQYKLFIIEDCAESLGASWQGKPTGSIGDCGCFSFFANKFITTGEGGMVTTNNDDLAEKISCYRDHGMKPDRRYWHYYAGLNYRMTNLQAAIGVSQLEQIELFQNVRAHIAKRYTSQLSNISGLNFQKTDSDAQSVCWLLSFTIDESQSGVCADEIRQMLAQVGVETRGFFYPLHQQPPYSVINKDFPASNWLAKNGISLPTYVGLLDSDIDWICQLIRQRLRAV